MVVFFRVFRVFRGGDAGLSGLALSAWNRITSVLQATLGWRCGSKSGAVGPARLSTVVSRIGMNDYDPRGVQAITICVSAPRLVREISAGRQMDKECVCVVGFKWSGLRR
jgi:hypothetical protein